MQVELQLMTPFLPHVVVKSQMGVLQIIINHPYELDLPWFSMIFHWFSMFFSIQLWVSPAFLFGHLPESSHIIPNRGRGYPDISATGANVPIIFQKRLTMVPGMPGMWWCGWPVVIKSDVMSLMNLNVVENWWHYDIMTSSIFLDGWFFHHLLYWGEQKLGMVNMTLFEAH